MSPFYRRAEAIFEVASAPQGDDSATAIVVDRAGCMRVLSSPGWSLAGLIQEFGADEVYKIEKVAGSVTVEGWSATNRCVIREKPARKALAGAVPGLSAAHYASMLQVTPQVAGGSKERSPYV